MVNINKADCNGFLPDNIVSHSPQRNLSGGSNDGEMGSKKHFGYLFLQGQDGRRHFERAMDTCSLRDKFFQKKSAILGEKLAK